MAPAVQNYSSHRRYDPLWHFAGLTLVLAGAIALIVRAAQGGSSWDWLNAAFGFGVLLVVFRARAQTLIVQDRLIRLEMRLRLERILPPALAGRIAELTPKQLVGLRFAGDAELAGLVERCLSGELRDGEAVKKQVTDWQADWLRA
jgi:hypothetical protein